MSELATRIVALLPRYRYRFGRETDLHAGIAEVLTNAKIPFVHEAIAGPRDRFDFLCERVVIEAKIKGSLSEAMRQVNRYCLRDDVDAVVLLSTKSWRVAPQLEIASKPVFVVRLGAGL